MGVCGRGAGEETNRRLLGMHWQHQRNHECHVGPAHDPSRDHSPNLPQHHHRSLSSSPSSSSPTSLPPPSPSSSMGDEELIGSGLVGSGASNLSGSSGRSTPNISAEQSIHIRCSATRISSSPTQSRLVGAAVDDSSPPPLIVRDDLVRAYGRAAGVDPSTFTAGIRPARCGDSPTREGHHHGSPPYRYPQQHQRAFPASGQEYRAKFPSSLDHYHQQQQQFHHRSRPSPHNQHHGSFPLHATQSFPMDKGLSSHQRPFPTSLPSPAYHHHHPHRPSRPANDIRVEESATLEGRMASGAGETYGGTFPGDEDRSVVGECGEGVDWDEEGAERGGGRGWGSAGEEGEKAICAGCGLRISDRFYLMAVERRWHASCLQCNQCWRTLDGDVTCFARDGHIYCKRDYYMLFGVKRCARCDEHITSTELVMRARDLVFHVRCFTCAACDAPLSKGDHFGMRSTSVFCRMHFGEGSEDGGSNARADANEEGGDDRRPRPSAKSPPLSCSASEARPPAQYASPSAESPDYGLCSTPPRSHRIHASTANEERRSKGRCDQTPPPPSSRSPLPPASVLPHLGPPTPHHHLPLPPSAVGGGVSSEGGMRGAEGEGVVEGVQFFNGAGSASVARQKGRPRKRKPKDLEGMTASLDLNTDPYLDVGAYVSRGGGGVVSPGGGVGHRLGGGSQQQRTKRMRTSFKHHQLRTMKSYFAINHNPDAKDLKQLSQKTGLPKRVLQVWFQNARAKWRRMILKQEGCSSKCPSDSGASKGSSPQSSSAASSSSSLLLALPSAPSPNSFHHEITRHHPPPPHLHHHLAPPSSQPPPPPSSSAGGRPHLLLDQQQHISDDREEESAAISDHRHQRQRFLPVGATVAAGASGGVGGAAALAAASSSLERP